MNIIIFPFDYLLHDVDEVMKNTFLLILNYKAIDFQYTKLFDIKILEYLKNISFSYFL